MNVTVQQLVQRAVGRLIEFVVATTADAWHALAWPLAVQYHAPLIAILAGILLPPLLIGIISRAYGTCRAYVCMAWNLVLTIGGYLIVTAAVMFLTLVCVCTLHPSDGCSIVPEWPQQQPVGHL